MAGPWVRGSQAQVRVRLLPGKLGWEHVVWGGDRLVWVSLAGKGRPPRDAVDMHEVHVHTHSQALLPNQAGGKTSTIRQNGLGRPAGLQFGLGAVGETEAQSRHGPVQGTW